MVAIASQITSPVNSPHKGPVTRKMFPFDDVIISCQICAITVHSRYLMVIILPITLKDTLAIAHP